MDAVSSTCRCSWDDVLTKTAIEFLNIICYTKDLAQKRKEEEERYIKNN